MIWQYLYWWLVIGIFILIVGTLLMRRVLHACESANNADWGDIWTNRIAGFIVLFCRHVHRFQYDSIPLPTKGCALVASNHISGLDPFLLIAASPRPLRFLIAREEYERFGLNWLFRRANCIPVDRERQPERAMREAMRALQEGDVVAVFPQGRIHHESMAPKHKAPRKLKGGVIRLAHQFDCPVYPLRVDDIRGAGLTALAIILPSRATLRAMPVLDCREESHKECLSTLTERLGLSQSSVSG